MCLVSVGWHLDDLLLGYAAASVYMDKPQAAAHDDAGQHVHGPKDKSASSHADKSLTKAYHMLMGKARLETWIDLVISIWKFMSVLNSPGDEAD